MLLVLLGRVLFKVMLVVFIKTAGTRMHVHTHTYKCMENEETVANL